MAKKPTTVKTEHMIAEGYKPEVAAAAAYAMKRKGQLSSKGGYRRKGKKRGPVGRQRADYGMAEMGEPKKLSSGGRGGRA